MKVSRFQCAVYFAIALGAAIIPLFSFPQGVFAIPGDQFNEVEPGFWRGGLPRKRGLEQLKTMGVRTVIDLMDEDPKKWSLIAANLGIRYVNIPMRRTRPIPTESIKQFLDIVEDPANRPIYVHCRAGKDRTGAMIAIYRMHACDWSSAQAIKEMKSLGFNPIFKSLFESVIAFKRKNQDPIAGARPNDSAVIDRTYK